PCLIDFKRDVKGGQVCGVHSAPFLFGFCKRSLIERDALCQYDAGCVGKRSHGKGISVPHYSYPDPVRRGFPHRNAEKIAAEDAGELPLRIPFCQNPAFRERENIFKFHLYHGPPFWSEPEPRKRRAQQSKYGCRNPEVQSRFLKDVSPPSCSRSDLRSSWTGRRYLPGGHKCSHLGSHPRVQCPPQGSGRWVRRRSRSPVPGTWRSGFPHRSSSSGFP